MSTIVVPESTSFFKTFTVGTIDDQSIEGLECDPWHVAGSKHFHQNPDDASIVEQIKNKFPRKDYNIKIGDTGYINWYEPRFGNYGWTTDITGRVVVCVGPWWGFQRYVHGQMMVWYHEDDSTYVLTSTPEIRKSLLDIVQAYQ